MSKEGWLKLIEIATCCNRVKCGCGYNQYKWKLIEIKVKGN